MEGKTQTPDSITTMLAPSLYDLVKKTIYGLWVDCLNAQKKINRDRVQITMRKGNYPGSTELKLGVLALWASIKYKLDYHAEENCVKQLRMFEAKGGFKQGDNLSLVDAEKAFDYMTQYLEISGVTRFEQKKPRADLELIDGLNEPD